MATRGLKFTHLVEKIDEGSGPAAPEVPSDSDFGWGIQEGLHVRETLVGGDLETVEVGPEAGV